MKHLFIALICTVIGFNASASDLAPKKNASSAKNIEVKIDMVKKDVKSSEVSNTITNTRRLAYGWKFKDACGNTMTVWCTGTSIRGMYAAAEAYVEEHTSWWSGCFN